MFKLAKLLSHFTGAFGCRAQHVLQLPGQLINVCTNFTLLFLGKFFEFLRFNDFIVMHRDKGDACRCLNDTDATFVSLLLNGIK